MRDDLVMYQTKTGNKVSLDLEEILHRAEVLKCACPGEVIAIVRSIRHLINQQRECLLGNPDGVVVHTWLTGEAISLEKSAVRILGELLQRENVVSSDYEFIER